MMRGRYADGVSFVDLAPIRDASHVVPTIAGVLGVRENPVEPLRERSAASLAERRILLVLDNCEQVLEAAGDIAALLATCPQADRARHQSRAAAAAPLNACSLSHPSPSRPARHLPDLAAPGAGARPSRSSSSGRRPPTQRSR